MWAILSGIEGNLPAYEAVIADIKLQSRYIEVLYIIGDLVGPRRECEQLVERVVVPLGNAESIVPGPTDTVIYAFVNFKNNNWSSIKEYQ